LKNPARESASWPWHNTVRACEYLIKAGFCTQDSSTWSALLSGSTVCQPPQSSLTQCYFCLYGNIIFAILKAFSWLITSTNSFLSLFYLFVRLLFVQHFFPTISIKQMSCNAKRLSVHDKSHFETAKPTFCVRATIEWIPVSGPLKVKQGTILNVTSFRGLVVPSPEHCRANKLWASFILNTANRLKFIDHFPGKKHYVDIRL